MIPSSEAAGPGLDPQKSSSCQSITFRVENKRVPARTQKTKIDDGLDGANCLYMPSKNKFAWVPALASHSQATAHCGIRISCSYREVIRAQQTCGALTMTCPLFDKGRHRGCR